MAQPYCNALTISAFFRGNYPEIPALLMGYANPFHRFGWDRLMDMSAAADVNGFIIPDLPPEECTPLAKTHPEQPDGPDIFWLHPIPRLNDWP